MPHKNMNSYFIGMHCSKLSFFRFYSTAYREHDIDLEATNVSKSHPTPGDKNTFNHIKNFSVNFFSVHWHTEQNLILQNAFSM